MSEVLLIPPRHGSTGLIVDDPQILAERYADFLHDESKLGAKNVSRLAFPKDADELSALLAESFEKQEAVTISNARTGICGGAVPPSGQLVSLDKMTRFSEPKISADGSASIQVGARISLSKLNEYLAANCSEYFFPVDPTETSAALGGMAATNASGARTYFYGPMREWVNWMRVVLADGSILEMRRGQYIAEAGTFHFKGISARDLTAQAIPKPKTKNTLGYMYGPKVDLIDLFIGSEGTLGVITDVELRLAKKPQHRLFYLQFFSSEDEALRFVVKVRDEKELRTLAIEFLDVRSLRIVQSSAIAKSSPAAAMIREEHQASVYLEVEMDSAEALETTFLKMAELLGEADPEQSYAGTSDRELRELKSFRHAVPEKINSVIAQRKATVPELHKIATDMAVPDEKLFDIYRFYVDELKARGFEYAIFGHAGNNHFHVNIMPRTKDELLSAKALYQVFAKKVIEYAGAVSSEHGIGRAKKDFLRLQYAGDVIDNMRHIRRFFDPRGILNPGVLFDDK